MSIQQLIFILLSCRDFIATESIVVIYNIKCVIRADVVKLVDTPDLGSGNESCGGSSPFVRTIFFS